MSEASDELEEAYTNTESSDDEQHAFAQNSESDEETPQLHQTLNSLHAALGPQAQSPPFDLLPPAFPAAHAPPVRPHHNTQKSQTLTPCHNVALSPKAQKPHVRG